MKASTWAPESTFYRLLRRAGEVRERRRQATHPAKVKPELIAGAPMRSGRDITKLRGPAKWSYYYLYVILDIFSRYVVGWMVASRETGPLAEVLIRQTCAKQGIERAQLTIHADRGSSMTSKPVAFLLADLGVTQSHSRPHVSNDNPFSEAQFKTLEVPARLPGRFGSIEDARQHCQAFFPWYNEEHRHTGLGLHTPPMSTTAWLRQSRTSVPVYQRRLHRTPRTVRPQTAQTPADPRNLVDQPPRPTRGEYSVNTAQRCLIQVDRFRCARSLVSGCRPWRPSLRYRFPRIAGVSLPSPITSAFIAAVSLQACGLRGGRGKTEISHSCSKATLHGPRG